MIKAIQKKKKILNLQEKKFTIFIIVENNIKKISDTLFQFVFFFFMYIKLYT